jgi:hypothetical protein
VLAADSWLDARREVLAGKRFIQKTGDLRKRERVIVAADTAAQISKQPIVRVRAAQLISDGDTL